MVPRQFLRAFVDQMDKVDELPDFEPMQEAGFKPDALTPEEQGVITGNLPVVPDPDDDELVPIEDAW